MNHNSANLASVTTPSSLSAIVARLRLLSGIIALVLGLLFFMLWFGHSMNSYIGSITQRTGHDGSEVVVTASAWVPAESR